MEYRLPLPETTVLQAQVAILAWELAQCQARILTYEHDRLLETAKAKYDQGLQTLLAPYQAQLPVPFMGRIDVEAGCLLYEAPATDTVPEPEHVGNVLPRGEALLS
jgi:hypothetical protein